MVEYPPELTIGSVAHLTRRHPVVEQALLGGVNVRLYVVVPPEQFVQVNDMSCS